MTSDKTTANNLDAAKEVYDAEVELGNSWAVGGRAGLLLYGGARLARPAACSVGTGGEVGLDDVADKVGGGRRRG